MVKGKAKINSSEDLPPPQTRSLRSRKRECPRDEASLTDDVQPTLHRMDTEGEYTGVVASLQQSALQKCAAIQNQPEEQSCFTKQDGSPKEKHAEISNVNFPNVAVTGKEETAVINPNNDSELESSGVHPDDTSGSRKNERDAASEECSGLPNQTSIDQLHVLLPVSEEGDESCAAALEKLVDEEESSNLETNQDTGEDTPSSVCMVNAKESGVGLPASKKRRMGMCGRTEKERNLFLRCYVPLHIAADCITEQSNAALKLQSSHCGEDDRAESEVHFAVTTSDGTSSVCDPGCSEGKGSEAEVGTVPGPELNGNPKSRQLTEEEEGENLGNQELRELKETTAEKMAEMPEEQVKRGEFGPAEVHLSSASTSHTNQNEEGDNQDAIKAAVPQMNSVAKTEEEWKGEMGSDTTCGEEEASSTDTKSEGLNCGSVELCEAAVTPSVPERNDNCDPEDYRPAGPSAGNGEHAQIRKPDDTYGSGCLDYVSDSQLNTIVFNEEEVTETEEQPDPSECLEDATDLICGLIRELSTLNRKVMAAHRELENLRRSSKTSRSSVR
ncbi:uncharacterized protein [Leuresthes tenuis]|uniref:uncharacterized protein n=1 Tax=Leuresthes tenuis TaxID=355514 RepID=UPI003B5149AA